MSDEARIWTGESSESFTTLRDRASRLATALHQAGVRAGDRVAVAMRNDTAYLEVLFAMRRLGAAPVTLNWHWTGGDLAHALTNSRSLLAVVHSDLVERVSAQAPELRIVEVEESPEVRTAYRLPMVGPTGKWPTMSELIDGHEPWDEPAPPESLAVFYTSGTTGLSKGVLRKPIADADRPSFLKSAAELYHLHPGETTVEPAPLYHAAPNAHAMNAIALNVNVHVMPRFDAEAFLRLVQDHKVTTVQMVPTMFTRLLQLPEEVRRSYDVSSLKAVITAAAPCPPYVKEAMIEWLGPVVYEYYGGSEVGAFTSCDSAQALARPGTVGTPVLDCRIRILGQDGAEKPVGEDGIIYGKVRSGWPEFTYIDDDEKRRNMENDGYLTLGDIGHLDRDGYLYLSDRLNDMVISGGVNIYPAEIEACLQQMAGVADVAVFGIPDPAMGEALAAYIQRVPGATLTAEQVVSHVAASLARYKVPREIVFVDELPREDTGKLFKRLLKQPYWANDDEKKDGRTT